jgi:hypothetical protein
LKDLHFPLGKESVDREELSQHNFSQEIVDKMVNEASQTFERIEEAICMN